jgi:hypothetical protein
MKFQTVQKKIIPNSIKLDAKKISHLIMLIELCPNVIQFSHIVNFYHYFTY